jgi:hypothetical protein
VCQGVKKLAYAFLVICLLFICLFVVKQYFHFSVHELKAVLIHSDENIWTERSSNRMMK